MIKTKLYPLYWLCFLSQLLNAQQDSSNLELKRLAAKDIALGQNDSTIQKVISATRSAIPLSQSPFETYVITQEEIRRFGCNTLVDVLRLVPGIRTSKVGSAMEGELFMANGLRGNSYFQFLINDVPIRPFSIVGMSMGAQFPIKQAERIEIQLGSCTTLYGPQAGGGVINIILKESERPVYTSADLAFGSDKYNNIDVNFGGKIGKGKRIFRFNAYGGFTTVNDVRNKVTYDPNFDADKYDPSLRYKEIGNYNYSDVSSVSRAKLPHFSRYLGFDLKGKRWFLSYVDMNRRDHSAIGLNPSVLKYEDGGSYLEDNISELTMGLNLKFSNFKFKSQLGFLNYKISNESSALYYNSQFNKTLDTLIKISKQYTPIENVDFIKLKLENTRTFFSGEEISFPFLTTMSYTLFKRVELVLGLAGGLALGKPIEKDADANAIDNLKLFGNIMPKTGISYKTEKTFAIVNYSTNIGAFGVEKNLRLGFDQNFKIAKHEFHFKLSSSFDKIYPSLYYFHTNKGTLFFNGSNNTQNWQNTDPSSYFFDSGHLISQPQVNIGTGLVYQKKNTTCSLRYDYFYLQKLYFYKTLTKTENITKYTQEYLYMNGFQNNSNTYRKFYKFSFAITNKQKLTKYYKQGFLQSAINYTHFVGKEKLEDGILPIIRQMPKNLFKCNIYIQISKSFSLGGYYNHTGIFYPSTTTVDLYKNKQNQIVKGSFNSIELFFAYHFNENFQAQLKIFNLQNKRNSGIEATETPDDLFFNSQPLRTIQVGLKYNLDKQVY